jgi:hypothetical protein
MGQGIVSRFDNVHLVVLDPIKALEHPELLSREEKGKVGFQRFVSHSWIP